MKEEHNVQYCGLCLTHDHQFYSEFSYYTKQELTMHKVVGEGRNTSHKGHPQCQICWHRFYDKDHLFKHMRKDHLFCHICDRRDDVEAIEGSNYYFKDYENLRKHFKSSHFSCEKDSCRYDKFTNAFASQMDLQDHNLKHHKDSKSKQQQLKERTIQIEPPRRHNLRNERPEHRDTPRAANLKHVPPYKVRAPEKVTKPNYPTLPTPFENHSKVHSW